MPGKDTPKIIPEEVQKEVARQITEALSLWKGGFKAFAERQNAEMERHEQEIEAKRATNEDKYRNGTKRTSGFIV